MTLVGDASKMERLTETNTPAGRLAMIRAWLYTVLGLIFAMVVVCLLYTSPSPRDRQKSRMPSSA